MSTSTLVSVDHRRSVGSTSRLIEYLELTKPKILTLVLVTVGLTAIIATWGQPELTLMFHTLVGTTLVAGSASVLNQWLERSTDAQMHRTQDRPIASGRVGTIEALSLGLVGILAGLAYLLNTTGPATALWASITWLIYVGIYTPLKRRTWLNTIVGAIPGALPVFIGWTGMGATIDIRAWCLFLLVFFWQFPHFMAIAWLYRKQYADAGMKMLTVVDPTGYRAGLQAVAAAFSVLLVSIAPAVLSMPLSPIYVGCTLALGMGQLYQAIQFSRCRNEVTARRLLRASLVYLPLQLLLITMLSLAVI